MLEAKYFKDYKHNYMILQCGQEEAVRSYQYKILTSDKIKEILRCSVRHINGTTYYYYDISSRATLKNLYQCSKMSYEQVKDLLWQLHGICEKLAGFFMEEAGLVLLPEHIYYDFSSQKYIGLYYPEYRAAEERGYEPLMDFLLEHIDTEDRQLAEHMYRICEMASETHFLIEDALQILEERRDASQGDFVDKAENGSVTEIVGMSWESLQGEDTKTGQRQGVCFATENDTEQYIDSAHHGQDSGPYKQSKSILYQVSAVLSVIGLAGAAVVYSTYELVQEETIALYGIMAVSGVCFLLSLWGICRQSGKRRQPADRAKERTDSLFEKTFRRDADFGESVASDRGIGRVNAESSGDDHILLDHIISRDMGLETPMPQERPVGRVPAGTHSMPAETASVFPETNDSSNTIFFDASKMAEYKLYAIDKKNKQHIDLKEFPCTIGKMAGCVDYVLADNSVSRIHARFDREEDRVFLTDMNSTNGTYKNGLRMQPQETVEIEPGDEIRFGNLNYCYR